jgi:hypothetical protein
MEMEAQADFMAVAGLEAVMPLVHWLALARMASLSSFTP